MALPSPSPATPASKPRVFARRMVSFTLLWGVILAALFSGRPLLSQGVFLIILCLLGWAGLAEFYGMARQRSMVCFAGWGMVGGFLLTVGVFLLASGRLAGTVAPAEVMEFEALLAAIFVLALCGVQVWSKDNPHGIQAVAVTLFGWWYVPWLLNFLQLIYFYPGINGTYYLLYFILVTKFSDSGAYAVGSLIGRHKMIPRISPGKTWEGLAGAVLVSVGGSVGFQALAGDRLAGMTIGHALGLGLALGLGAVLGDLVESLFKREAGLKDSGRTFPGIGGILDLLDSLLFNAPIMYLFMRHVLALPAQAPSTSLTGSL